MFNHVAVVEYLVVNLDSEVYSSYENGIFIRKLTAN
jgi:hypothetical protein